MVRTGKSGCLFVPHAGQQEEGARGCFQKRWMRRSGGPYRVTGGLGESLLSCHDDGFLVACAVLVDLTYR